MKGRIKTNSPLWKEVYSHAMLPEELSPLGEISTNLWWVWNHEGAKLFSKLDKALWTETEGNPVLLLQRLTYGRIREILADKELMSEMKKIHARFRAYVDEKPDSAKSPSVAYFSMEYGLTNVLKIYSGGLGVLAGDYLKEASDSNIDLCAVGFLYRYGYFTQSLTIDGQQVANYEEQNFHSLPLTLVTGDDKRPLLLEVPFPGRTVYAHVWKVSVGRIPLYLMDTDISENSDWDRSITHQLYGGDWENRMKQEYMLGIGGMLLLEKLGIRKQVYHCNEGHAALINVQRLVNYVREGLTFAQALEVVRASSLYTVHTPVPAGHDYFEEELFRRYTGDFPTKLGISWQDFIDMGRENPGSTEKFSMSVFALNTSQEANGVSWLHGKVSRRMFAPVWKGYFPDELHVGYVTNGVHMPTWAATETKKFFTGKFDDDFFNHQSDKKYWEEIYNVPDVEIWELRKSLKRKFINYINIQYGGNRLTNQGTPAVAIDVHQALDPKALFIGFGRRFATYKRAHLLFDNLERLARIVNDPDHPVRFIFTGKAHPADGGGQGLIKYIVEISRRPEFVGKILFLENYDMRLARHLIAGVDVWLNTPTRPLEASGTSGEKAEMNGVLNFSVLDGWWYEGYRQDAGWALTDKRTYEDQKFQDQLDAATIYTILEREIIPAYFDNGPSGYSTRWVGYIKNSFAQIAPDYTMQRMLNDYIDRFYRRLATRSGRLTADNYALVKELAAWKDEVVAHWDSFTVESFTCTPDFYNEEGPIAGCEYVHRLTIDRHELRAMLGVDMVVLRGDGEENHLPEVVRTSEFQLVSEEGSRLHFELHSVLNESGRLKIGFRVFPKHEALPHRMDFAFVRWIEVTP
ncbi:MAG: alpha-glucan family phosphorylase [Tannerellaceae bacterium]|jgi:starch phosphorylase|nr:alpha-glucan family phosphorylase [Tannerellaceae bacterium]